MMSFKFVVTARIVAGMQTFELEKKVWDQVWWTTEFVRQPRSWAWSSLIHSAMELAVGIFWTVGVGVCRFFSQKVFVLFWKWEENVFDHPISLTPKAFEFWGSVRCVNFWSPLPQFTLNLGKSVVCVQLWLQDLAQPIKKPAESVVLNKELFKHTRILTAETHPRIGNSPDWIMQFTMVPLRDLRRCLQAGPSLHPCTSPGVKRNTYPGRL